MNNLVSVIIPTYNRPHLIGRAVKSVLNQTYKDFEIVIIDSSLDDKTEQAVKNLGYDRIKYIHNSVKTVAPAARNQGVRESSEKSKYIAFLDDDDEFFPRFLENTVSTLEYNNELVMVTSDLELRRRDGKKIRVAHGSIYPWEQGIGCGCVVKKDLFAVEDYWYDEKSRLEDWDLGIRVLKNHKWACVRESLWAYYVYPAPGESTVTSNILVADIDLFFEKYQPLFRKFGKKALSHFYCRTGKIYLRSKQKKKGLFNLMRGFLVYPNVGNLLSFFLSIFAIIFPSLLKNSTLRGLKQKLFKGKF